MNIYSARQQMREMSIYEMPLRVAFYARVSSEKDEQLNSLSNQTQYYTDYIKKNSRWTFAGGYVDEGISGISTEKRENFHRMIDDAKAGKFDYVITKEISRFARNTVDSISYTRFLLKCGVAVFFQNDNINTLDEDSELRLTIMSGIAQDELRKLSSRIKFGHQQAIKNGVVLGNDNLYGYKKQKGKMVVDEEWAPMVRLIFEEYALGTSTPKLEKMLFEKGWRSFNGKKISRGVIQHIITNPKYKGYYVGNKVKVTDMFTKEQQFLPEEEWVMYKDESGETVPAIVSEEVWDKANAIYTERSTVIKERRSSFKKEENSFTRKIVCAEDGSVYWLKERYDRNGNNRSRWVCSSKLKNGASFCRSFHIMEDELKEVLIEVLNDISGNFEEVVSKYIAIYEKAVQSKDFSEEIKNLEEKIEKVNEKKDKILEYNLNGQISDDEFIKRNSRFNLEIEKLEKEILQLKSDETKERNSIAEIYSLKNNFIRFKDLKAEDLTQSVINLFINKIYAKPVDERHMSLEIVLNTGSRINKAYEKTRKIKTSEDVRSGNVFKKMIEAQEKQMAGK